MVMATPELQPAARAATSDAPLLQIEGLEIHFNTPRGVARVVDGTNLTIYPNEIVGIAGESGCGKTTLVEAILQIIRFPNRVARGKVLFTPRDGKPVDLMKLNTNQMRRYRTEHIAYVPQGSQNSLNPVMRIEDQIIDGMVAHGVGGREAKGRVPALLEKVGMEGRVGRLYPHELSGGMKQRVIIAIGISMNPELIIADEPTTALDVNVQRLILETLHNLRDELGVAILLVSHDLPVHAQLADRIGIMYAGQVVEIAEVRPGVKNPLHPYAAGLMRSIPAIGGSRERLSGIKGSTPSPLNWPAGCRFHNRCPAVMPVCESVQPLLAEPAPGEREIRGLPVKVEPDRMVACHLFPESTPDGVQVRERRA